MNDEVDKKLSASKPYRNWLKENAKHLEANLHTYSGPEMREISDKYFRQSCKSFLLNKEEIEMLKGYALESNEPTGSMGDDKFDEIRGQHPEPPQEHAVISDMTLT